VRIDAKGWLEREPELEELSLRERAMRAVTEAYDAKVARTGAAIMRHVEKDVMLRMLDQHWREHLGAMDYLRQGIHLRGYAQKDYRFEFKREGFELFSAMLDRIKYETASLMAKIEVRTQEEIEREEEERRRRLMRALQAQHAEAGSLLAGGEEPQGGVAAGVQAATGAAAQGASGARPAPAAEPARTFVRSERKVGRNEPCPCGSGKKYKHCHGALSSVE
jgi:preprotein translocase subunit SecA